MSNSFVTIVQAKSYPHIWNDMHIFVMGVSLVMSSAVGTSFKRILLSLPPVICGIMRMIIIHYLVDIPM